MISIDDEDEYNLLENVMEEFGSKFFFTDNNMCGIYMSFEDSSPMGLIEIDTDKEMTLSLTGQIETIRFVSSDIKVLRIDINSEEQVIIEGYDTDNTKINTIDVKRCYRELFLNSVLVDHINTGEYFEALSLEDSTIKEIKFLSGNMGGDDGCVGSTIETMDVYTKSIVISDCKNYNINEPHFELCHGYNDVYEYKEQIFNLKDTVKTFTIQDDISSDVDKITITSGKNLEELIIEDEDIIIEISQETFMNLKSFEGDKDNIEFSKFDGDQSNIIWEILKLKI